jgi:hypothetical protein
MVAAQSSRLAEFGGLGMSFNICRGPAWQLGDVQAAVEQRKRATSTAKNPGIAAGVPSQHLSMAVVI